MDLFGPTAAVGVVGLGLACPAAVGVVRWLLACEPDPEGEPVKFSTLIAVFLSLPDRARRCLCRQDRQPAEPCLRRAPDTLRRAYYRSRN